MAVVGSATGEGLKIGVSVGSSGLTETDGGGGRARELPRTSWAALEDERDVALVMRVLNGLVCRAAISLSIKDI